MRRSLILIVSAGLNVVLAAALFFPAHREASAPPAAATNLPPGDVSNRIKTQVVVRRQYFTWNEVESSDYRIYIARLRDIGCPERTIRDIVVADVNELYARKRMSEVVTPDQHWWRSDPDTNVVMAANLKLQALDQERRGLLASLLGPNWEAEDLSRSIIPLNGPVLGELSPEVKQSVQNIVARAQQRLQGYLNAQQSQGRQPDPVELTRLGQQMRSELATVLNPAQVEEFLLRYSPTANELREQLRGFAVTPDDFRLFRLRDPIAQQMHLLNPDDAVNAPRLQALQKQLDDSLKQVLSPDQYGLSAGPGPGLARRRDARPAGGRLVQCRAENLQGEPGRLSGGRPHPQRPQPHAGTEGGAVEGRGRRPKIRP